MHQVQQMYRRAVFSLWIDRFRRQAVRKLSIARANLTCQSLCNVVRVDPARCWVMAVMKLTCSECAMDL
jgi:hypothetical protein